MDDSQTLRGLRVLVTRPQTQAETLCRLLAARGADVRQLPLQAIESVRQSTQIARQLQAGREADGWIFTSVNAVRFAAQLDAGVWPQCIAVGAATAAALSAQGQSSLMPTSAYTSEGILELPELQEIGGKRYLIVTGEGGRNMLAPELQARGAEAQRVEVYRRIPLPHAPEAVAQALHEAHAVLITSGEALERLLQLTSEAQRNELLHSTRLVVPSQRVVEQAFQLGFTPAPLVPDQVTDAAYVQCLEQWWSQHGIPPRSRMTDDNTTLTDSRLLAVPEDGAPSSAAGRFWLALLLMVAIAAAGWGLWRYSERLQATIAAQSQQLQQMAQDMNALEVQADRLDQRQGDLAAIGQRNGSALAEFGARIDAHDEIVGRINEQISGSRDRFQLASVEQLLILANDRLLLARDVDAAVVALDEADQRLAALRDPRLFAVRQALAQERTALQAVARPDQAGAALTLASLIARVPRLPLATRPPEHFQARPEPVVVPADARWWQRAAASVRAAVSSLFTVRRNAGPAAQRLTEEQETLVTQVLAMKLEGARLAMLGGDTVSFRDLCESASRWMADYFRVDDPGVLAAQAELERLRPLNFNPPLPDISRSLSLLRTHLEPAAP